MSAGRRILIAGETWITTATHTKGFDSFTTSSFGEGYSYLKAALERGGFTVDVIENHVAALQFPGKIEELEKYAAVILSDIGANTLLLAPPTWRNYEIAPNRLELIGRYVKNGGGLIMVGGYLTFTGIEGKGFWRGTAVEDALPVTLSAFDDRSERPEGIVAEVVDAKHPAVAKVGGKWPALLGYNRVTCRPDATLVATVGGDPLIATRTVGAGRSAVFTSDCSPHWCPPAFIQWPGYDALWQGLVGWVSARG